MLQSSGKPLFKENKRLIVADVILMLVSCWFEVYPIALLTFIGLIGHLCNLTVVAANGYKMPVLCNSGDQYVGTHTNMTFSSRFKILADVIPYKGRVMSIGDVFMCVSLYGTLLYALYLLVRVYLVV